MRVIFIKDLDKNNKKGDIKEVKDGYANFLIKQGIAVPENKQNLNVLNQEKQEKKEQEEQEREKSLELKKKLDGKTFDFKVKTGEGDKVFGSISSKAIKEEIEKSGIKIEKRMIDIKNNIDTLGFHDVKVNLYPKVYATIKVHLIK